MNKNLVLSADYVESLIDREYRLEAWISYHCSFRSVARAETKALANIFIKHTRDLIDAYHNKNIVLISDLSREEEILLKIAIRDLF